MRKLPTKHISIRVPWHDSGWNGCVCEDPKGNAACLVLNRIREMKNDDAEEPYAGKPFWEIEDNERPVCQEERANFMSPEDFTRHIPHPYSKFEKIYEHIKPTLYHHPAYSAGAVPYRWMNRDYAEEIAEEYGLDYDPQSEPTEPVWIKDSAWIQGYENQRTMLDAFFSAIEPDESLCFFYAKRIPYVEDERNVLIGVGKVKLKGKLIEYDHKPGTKDGRRVYIWDRAIHHSIREDFKDGFIMPYHEILKQAENDPSINPADFVAFTPTDGDIENRRIEFAYASEHVSHAAAVASLYACKNALQRALDNKLLSGSWNHVFDWIDTQLQEVAKISGPYPGLGAVLKTFGMEQGVSLSHYVLNQIEDDQPPWDYLDKVFHSPSSLPKEYQNQITPLQNKWIMLKSKTDKFNLFKLLSRFELTVNQAIRYFLEEKREEAGIDCTDEEIVCNPYLIYEEDRFSVDSIGVGTIDRGLYQPDKVYDNHPLPELSNPEGPTDPNRVSALIIAYLEKAADEGHTLQSRKDIVLSILDADIQPKCNVDGLFLEAERNRLSNEIQHCEINVKNSKGEIETRPAYQLDRLARAGKLIRKTVEKRINAQRHELNIDWRKRLDEKLQDKPIDPEDKDEQKAREEKTQALKELAESRFSVLIGPAGTGKTTLLSVLCNEESIKKGRVLLLSPTGKARVKLQQSTGIQAKTIAQFLLPLDRYDQESGNYKMSQHETADEGKTVIVDEASMLTEMQLAALIDGLTGVHRLILVGDPRQLPPIGAGRPFLDIVKYLEPGNVEAMPIKVAKGYAELTVRRRQIGEIREDLQLAEWFSGRQLGPGDDEIFERIMKEDEMEHLKFVSWDDADELQEKLLTVLADELKLEDINDSKGFELKLGGTQSDDGHIYFNRGIAEKVEAWQILSPVRGMNHGVFDLNRLIQKQFRKDIIDFASRQGLNRQIPKPVGAEGIVYGDKVINVMNTRRYWVYPKEDALQYVANGEIGIVIGEFRCKGDVYRKGPPNRLYVEFSSQPTFSYTYTKRKDFQQEWDSVLELAYAITVHKSQGSEFNLCLLVLPNPCWLLSRELLYTALTRQIDRIIILHQGDRSELRKYASDYHSSAAKRLTNLFENPMPTPVHDKLLENNLIHVSSTGIPMRSKSEVIIANLLSSAGIDYKYEEKLEGPDGEPRFPDFTIEDFDSGITYYWEHLGLLSDKHYRERWKRKKIWYKDMQIIPLSEGGGKNGTLITTEDTLEGGIDAQQIKELIIEIWG